MKLINGSLEPKLPENEESHSNVRSPYLSFEQSPVFILNFPKVAVHYTLLPKFWNALKRLLFEL